MAQGSCTPTGSGSRLSKQELDGRNPTMRLSHIFTSATMAQLSACRTYRESLQHPQTIWLGRAVVYCLVLNCQWGPSCVRRCQRMLVGGATAVATPLSARGLEGQAIIRDGFETCMLGMEGLMHSFVVRRGLTLACFGNVICAWWRSAGAAAVGIILDYNLHVHLCPLSETSWNHV